MTISHTFQTQNNTLKKNGYNRDVVLIPSISDFHKGGHNISKFKKKIIDALKLNNIYWVLNVYGVGCQLYSCT